jgi:hypothetical protein
VVCSIIHQGEDGFGGGGFAEYIVVGDLLQSFLVNLLFKKAAEIAVMRDLGDTLEKVVVIGQTFDHPFL